MKKIVLLIILCLLPIQPAYANQISLHNHSSMNIDLEAMEDLAYKYKKLVLKHWKVTEYPIDIYFVDDWMESAKPSVKDNYMAYHWYSVDHPHIYINVNQVKRYGASLTFVMTHELGEAIVNPFVDKYVIHKNRTVYIEICDPTHITFTIGRYKVSDFVYPSYYQIRGKSPYSHTRIIKRPFQNISGLFYMP